MCVALSMTVTSIYLYLRGLVIDPRVADKLLRGLVDDPRVVELLRGLVDDPRVAELLRGRPMVEPRVICLHGPVIDPRGDAGGLVIDPRIHFPLTIPQGSSEDSLLALKKLIVVLFVSLSFESFRRGIG